MASMVSLGQHFWIGIQVHGSIEYGSGSPGFWVKSKADTFGWFYWLIWRIYIHRSSIDSESRYQMHNYYSFHHEGYQF